MKDNPRYVGSVLRKSQKFKDIYKNRTSTERINNRVLNDYHLQDMRVRDYAKVAFFMHIVCINIHLDAWIKQDKTKIYGKDKSLEVNNRIHVRNI